MKTAIEISGNTNITCHQFKDLVKHIETVRGPLGKPENWNFGNVDVCTAPDWVAAGFEDVLSELNSLGAKYRFRTTATETVKCNLLFGRGSMGTHKDKIDGLTVLTFLGSFIPGKNDDAFSPHIPCFHHRDGQFFQGKFFDLHQGDSVLFDDREDHAWISNAYWIFASAPVTKVRKAKCP